MRASKRPLHPVTALGLVLLIIANVTAYVLSRHTTLAEHTADPLAGFLQGLAIGVLILGVAMQAGLLKSRADRCA